MAVWVTDLLDLIIQIADIHEYWSDEDYGLCIARIDLLLQELKDLRKEFVKLEK